MDRIVLHLAVFALCLIVGTNLVGAAKLGWVLNGDIVSASTCQPIAGANVTAQYNDYSFNITNQYGNYSIVLGTGNWSVIVNAEGYWMGVYNAIYHYNGGMTENLALLPLNGTVGSCFPYMKNTTYLQNQQILANSTTIGTTTISTSYSTTIQGTGNKGGFSYNYIEIAIASFIVICLLILIVLILRKGK